MNPIFRKEVIYTVDYDRLDRFIADYAGLKDFEGTLEASNDTDFKFNIDGKMDEYDIKKAEEILKRGHCEHYYLRTILNYLCSKKAIKKGTYLVEVSW